MIIIRMYIQIFPIHSTVLGKHVPTVDGLMSLTKIINSPQPVNPSQIQGISSLQLVSAGIQISLTEITTMMTATVTAMTADIL